MRRNERGLRVLQRQIQFEVVQVGAEVALAAYVSRRMQQQTEEAERRFNSTADGIRTAMQSPVIDLRVLSAMRQIHQVEHQAWHAAREQLTAAAERESQAREAFAALRARERALARALRTERRKQEIERQTVAFIHVDEGWVQHVWRESFS